MPKIEGLDRVVAKLEAMHRREENVSVITGFTQSYALFVHENMTAQHAPGKRAKYLEEPARRLSNEGTLGRIVEQVYRKTKDMGKALLIAGLRIQREAQRIVPIDTGALKASAFTVIEKQPPRGSR